MKILLATLIILSSYSVSAQNNLYLVTLKGIGIVKLGMTKTSIEKLTGKPITFKNISLHNPIGYDTVNLTIKGLNMNVCFKNTETEVDNAFVDCICSDDKKIRTKNGVGIWDNKAKVIRLNKKYALTDNDDEQMQSKSRSSLKLHESGDDANIIFNFYKDKLESICVQYSNAVEGD